MNWVLRSIRGESARGGKQLREEVVTTLRSISETMATTFKDLAEAQKTQLERMSSEIGKLSDSTERKLEAVRVGVEGKLQSIQVENANQLELMRQTVDEKLQGTLEKRLGDSFKQVSERLEQVHKGFGEMQALASGVGDLKKVLTNVKTRGTWAEVQLGTMLEQMLNPDQFATPGHRVDRLDLQTEHRGDFLCLEQLHSLMPLNHSGTIEDYLSLSRRLRQTSEGINGTLSKPTMRGLCNLRTRTWWNTSAAEVHRLRMDALRPKFQERTAELFSNRARGQKDWLANGASWLRSLLSR
jgi:hypothetical protein